VTEFVRNSNVENEVQLIEPLRKELAAGISQLITFINDDENLEAKWALTKMLAVDRGVNYGNFGKSLYKCMKANREIVADIEKAAESHPEEMENLLGKVREFDRKRRKKGMSIYSFSKSNNALKCVGKAFAAMVGLPYYIFSAVVSSPMWITYFLLKGKIRDRAFHNTIGFGIKLSLGTILTLIYAILAFCLLNWPLAIAFLLLSIPSYSYFFDYNEGVRRFISDIKTLNDKKMKGFHKDIVKAFDKI
jgi:hypothetical protein